MLKTPNPKLFSFLYRPTGPVVASTWRAAELGSNPTFAVDLFSGWVIPVTQKLILQWLSCQAPGVIKAALGLVDLVLVYCDWMIQLLFLLLQRSAVVQVRSSVWLMSQYQLSGRGLLPSPTAWLPDQHHAAMLADVSRKILIMTIIMACMKKDWQKTLYFIFTSLRLCTATAEHSLPSMPSIVICLMLSCSRWFPPSLLCCLDICLVIPLNFFLPLDATLCSVWSICCPSFLLYRICPAHFHFYFSVYFMVSVICVVSLISGHGTEVVHVIQITSPCKISMKPADQANTHHYTNP